MEKFMNKTIPVDKFEENFSFSIKNLNNLSNKLKFDFHSKEYEFFNPDFLRYPGFTNLSIFLLVELDNFDDYSNYEEFYRTIKEQFFHLQKVLNRTEGIEEKFTKDEN
jgi:hypothetical protein